jgi:hypothetical protein
VAPRVTPMGELVPGPCLGFAARVRIGPFVFVVLTNNCSGQRHHTNTDISDRFVINVLRSPLLLYHSAATGAFEETEYRTDSGKNLVIPTVVPRS